MSDEFDNVLKRVIQGAQKQWEGLQRDFPELQVTLHDADLVTYANAHGLALEDLTDAQKQEAFTDAVLAMHRQEKP